MPPKPTLGPIVIGVNSIEKALPFYVNVFGIKVERQDDTYLSAHMEDGTHIEFEMENEHRFPNWKAHNVGTYKNSEAASAPKSPTPTATSSLSPPPNNKNSYIKNTKISSLSQLTSVIG